MNQFKQAVIYHSILLEGQKQRILLELEKIIRKFNTEILNSIDFEKSPQSNNRLLIQIMNEMYKNIDSKLKEELKEIAIYENEFYNLLLNNFVIKDERSKKLTQEEQSNLLLGAIFFGKTIKEQLDNNKIVNVVKLQNSILNNFNQKKNLENELIILKKSIKDIDDKKQKEDTEKKISKIESKQKTNTEIKKEILNTALANNSANLKTVSNSSVSLVSNTLRDEVNIKNDIIFYQYTAVLDRRTTEICRGLNGNVYRVDNKNAPRPPQHLNCRSFCIPVSQQGDRLTANDDLTEFEKEFGQSFTDENGNFTNSRKNILSIEKALELERKKFNI